MTTVMKYDWAEAWDKHIAETGYRKKIAEAGITSEEYWSQFNLWDELHRYTNYPGIALDRILGRIEPCSSVLDIGAGDGAFTVPLAKVSKSVTAVEPSPGQVTRLKSKAEAEKLSNVKIIQKRWEQVEPSEIGTHDVVVAAYCFLMDDIRSALEQVCASSRRWVFLLHLADHDLLKPLGEMLAGFRPGTDYIYLYNILYEIGYRPTVEIITRRYEIPFDLQIDVCSYSYHLSPADKEFLRERFQAEGKMIWKEERLWIEREYKDALITIQS